MKGNHIKSLRQLTGLTQNEFAQLLGVTSMSVLRWENGKSQPTLANMRRIETLIGAKNLQIVQSTFIHNLPLLEVVEDIQKRIGDKLADVER